MNEDLTWEEKDAVLEQWVATHYSATAIEDGTYSTEGEVPPLAEGESFKEQFFYIKGSTEYEAEYDNEVMDYGWVVTVEEIEKTTTAFLYESWSFTGEGGGDGLPVY